jgi:hypothetical protein
MENIKLVKPTGRYAVITGVLTKSFMHPKYGYKKKLILKVVDGNCRTFMCSDVWDRQMRVRSLLIKGNSVQTVEPLGQFMEYLGVKSTDELINKVVFIYPDKNNFLIPACFDHKFLLSQNR